MPEVRETVASAMCAKWGLEEYEDSPKQVLGMFADMTDKEEEHFDAADGLVRELDGSEWEVLRGQTGGQTPLMPSQLLYSYDGDRPEVAITDLEVKSTDFHERALLLDLGPLKLKVTTLATYS
jgi:hypothetical protein